MDVYRSEMDILSASAKTLPLTAWFVQVLLDSAGYAKVCDLCCAKSGLGSGPLPRHPKSDLERLHVVKAIAEAARPTRSLEPAPEVIVRTLDARPILSPWILLATGFSNI